MLQATGVVPGFPSWGNVVLTASLIAIGMLVPARIVAWTVRPGRKSKMSELAWLWFTSCGFALVVLATAGWTFVAIVGYGGNGGLGETVAATVIAGLIVIFAVLVLALWREGTVRWHSDGFQPGPLVMGVVSGLLVAGLAYVAISFASQERAAGFAGTAVVTVAGVAVFGVGLGQRLRMRLTVRGPDGEEDGDSAAYVVARIQTMGSHRPRGFQFPCGSDVTTLPQQATAAMPTNIGKVLAVIMELARELFSIAPWRAEVVIADETTVTVDLRRNGGQAASTLIFRSSLGLDDLPDRHPSPGSPMPGGQTPPVRHDILTAVAAFLLIELSQRHLVLQSGLCGTSEWRSLACQVLAGTPPLEDNPDTREQLLATAVEKDAGNLGAWLGYLHLRSGMAVGTLQTEKLYLDRLNDLSRRLDEVAAQTEPARLREGFVPLQMRIAFAIMFTAHNYQLLLHQKDGGTGNGDKQEKILKTEADIGTAYERLETLGAQAEKGRDKEVLRFARELRSHAQILYSAHGCTQVSQQVAHDNLLGYYLRACLIAEKQAPDRYPEALDLLDIALGAQKWRQEALTDPSLRNLWDDRANVPHLKSLVDRPQLARIAILQPYIQRLRGAGVLYPAQFLRRIRADAGGLATSLHLPEEITRWIAGICELIDSCPDSRQAFAWTDLLTHEGIDTVCALAELLTDDADEQERLTRLAPRYRAVQLSKDGIPRVGEARPPSPGSSPHLSVRQRRQAPRSPSSSAARTHPRTQDQAWIETLFDQRQR